MAYNQSIQTGLKQATNANLTNYALFLGGTNVTNEVLAQYDPLRTGYGRLFMVRSPAFMQKWNPDKTAKFKHILEYGNTAISGLNDVSVEFNPITGGYVGKSFEIPSVAKDDTTTFSVTVYEFSGSPIREYLHSWINGVSDLLTGLCHYNGVDNMERKQSNQTAEFIYVATDNTGENIEYACLLANCFPRGINTDVFNYTAGEHNIVDTQIEFSCTKYESIQINYVAQTLLRKYKILQNSIAFNSGFESSAQDLNYAEANRNKTGLSASSSFYEPYNGMLQKETQWSVAGKPVFSNAKDYNTDPTRKGSTGPTTFGNNELIL